ncbi:substrate-binding domain-containing protein [Nitrosococcus oceani]|uniref:substrate-binding domain-containing protein n=1 Tax=Nitrosococcus oceani TaxID=1229 RepID=UPI0004E864B2|nr:substrate-binding domain-containing protein [Nitrosococcus oceani]KFI21910.1 ABC transporter substrate-binding protein [Nitrosococcus oceani]
MKFLSLIMVWALAFSAHGAELYVYGPGGPAPAMKAAAAAFEKASGTKVVVTAGPTPTWIEAARGNADLLYSGSEHMMSDFLVMLGPRLAADTVRPMYLRPAAILVRPGNPAGISGLADLLKPGYRVLVVHGAGQVGLWEDIAGRDGDITTLRALRSNIVHYATNTGAAKERWLTDPKIDAWIVYNIWAIANPGIADMVPLEPHYRIYRDCGIVLTEHSRTKPEAQAFTRFLESDEGRAIFERFGWVRRDAAASAAKEGH